MLTQKQVLEMATKNGYLTKERVADWSFWPADRHLERVRWPEHDGQML